MANHKCYFCGKPIDGLDLLSCKRFKNSYGSTSFAHEDCYKLYEYAGKCIHNLNAMTFRNQLKKYISDGMTVKGVALALRYWYKVKKNTDEKANGSIGIVPYIYQDAQDFYKKRSEQQEKAKRFKSGDYNAYLNFMNQPLSKVQKRKPPQKPRGIKYIDLK